MHIINKCILTLEYNYINRLRTISKPIIFLSVCPYEGFDIFKSILLYFIAALCQPHRGFQNKKTKNVISNSCYSQDFGRKNSGLKNRDASVGPQRHLRGTSMKH